jgi:glutamyl-tRNA synthetase
VFDTAKLEWMNGQYLSQLSADELLAPTQRELERMGISSGERDLRPLIDSVKARSRTILNIAEQVAVRLDASRVVRDEKGQKLAAKLGDAFGANLRLVVEALEGIPEAEWQSERILEVAKGLAEARGAKLGDLLQPVRVVLTGSTVSEPVNDLLVVVGRAESLARLRSTAGH